MVSAAVHGAPVRGGLLGMECLAAGGASRRLVARGTRARPHTDHLPRRRARLAAGDLRLAAGPAGPVRGPRCGGVLCPAPNPTPLLRRAFAGGPPAPTPPRGFR